MAINHEIQARSTANYLRTILISALGYTRENAPTGMVGDYGLDSRGTLRVEIVLSPEDAQKLATMLNREDIRDPDGELKNSPKTVLSTGTDHKCDKHGGKCEVCDRALSWVELTAGRTRCVATNLCARRARK